MKYRTAKIEITMPATDDRKKDWKRLQEWLSKLDRISSGGPERVIKLWPEIISLSYKTEKY